MGEYIIRGFHVLRDTGCQLVITLVLLAYLIHNVIDRDTSYQTSDTIDYGQGYQVVFLDRLRNLLDTVAVANGDRVFFHAVDLMRELDEDTQEEILSHIEDVEQAGDIVDLLKYDEDTAGGLMGG